MRSAVALVLLVGCGSSPSSPPVSFVNTERPTGYNGSVAPTGLAPTTRDSDDDDFAEPEHPAAATKQERAMVHIHGPKGVICSGVVVGPKLVATAQRCVRDLPRGATALDAEHEFRVEVASSTLTWTNRKAKMAVLPRCDEGELDVAILVLEEAVPALVVPLQVASAPDAGARVNALGFGHCPGSKPAAERMVTVRSRAGAKVVVDMPLCKGDVGGPVIDGREGEVIGLISQRDDPEGSPLKTTAVARLDTTGSRHLVTQAQRLAEGGAPDGKAVGCR